MVKEAMMPNRIIREGILNSDRVSELDWPAEVFYRRLLNKVDDHGLYDARPSVLRTSLYPLKVDRVREADCTRWLAECEKARLLVLYEAAGKPYLKVLDTRWQTRSEPKYPQPQAIERRREQLQTVAPVVVVEGVVEDEVGKNVAGQLPGDLSSPKNGHDREKEKLRKAQAVEILLFLNEKAGKHYEIVDSNIDLIAARLKEGAKPDDMRAVIAKRCRDWLTNPDMNRFLQPATLFSKKNWWQKYQGEIPPQ